MCWDFTHIKIKRCLEKWQLLFSKAGKTLTRSFKNPSFLKHWQAREIREWISQQGRDDILDDGAEKRQYNRHRHRAEIMSVVGTWCRDDATLVLRSSRTIEYHCNMYLGGSALIIRQAVPSLICVTGVF